MKAPNDPSNFAERAIAEFYQGGLSKAELVQRLMPGAVHIPMDGPAIVDEEGSASDSTGLCLPKPDGQMSLVLVTSYPMFAPMVEAFPQYSRTFANYTLETVVVHTAPEYGLIINPMSPFELEISSRFAAEIRGPLHRDSTSG